MHNACMTVNITIRNVPVKTRDRIAERARSQGQSMQEYLLGELEALGSKPTVKEWVDRARRRAIKAGAKVTTEDIIASIREDRGR
jgi:hypothetical protein